MRVSDDKNGDLKITCEKKIYGVLDTISKTIHFYGPSKIIKLILCNLIFWLKNAYHRTLCSFQAENLKVQNKFMKHILWVLAYHIQDHILLQLIQYHKIIFRAISFSDLKVFSLTPYAGLIRNKVSSTNHLVP